MEGAEIEWNPFSLPSRLA